MSKAIDILNKHLSRKGLTTEHIHVAAYTSCIDAIDEALNMHFVSKSVTCGNCEKPESKWYCESCYIEAADRFPE